MTETLYTGDIPVADLPHLIMACHFSEPAWILAERFPDQASITTKDRRVLLQFTHFPTNISTDNAHTGYFFSDDPKIPITYYHTGRVFQADAELRWEKQGGMMHVIYIGPKEYSSVMKDYKLNNPKKPKKPNETEEQDLFETLEKRDELRYYYLFGERIRKDDLAKMGSAAKRGDFAEVRIPRLLHYPLSPDATQRYARLSVCEYLDKKTGEVQLFRFQALEPWE